MAVRTRRANARKSAVRAAVEPVFARQKRTMGLMIRTIGHKAIYLARQSRRAGIAAETETTFVTPPSHQARHRSMREHRCQAATRAVWERKHASARAVMG